MKKLLLTFITLLFTTAAFSQNVLNIINKSNQFFDLMEQQKFAEVHSLFADSIKTKISEENLKVLWGNVNTNLGETESIEIANSQKDGDYFRVSLEGKFKYAEQNFILVFDKGEKLVGFFLPPSAKKTVYINPAYADTTLYQEKYVYVNSGKHQLAAVLTTPKNVKKFPIVVLIHGSGPSDMDGSYGPNKPIKDLASGLAAKGIASLRYVKRTLVYANEFVGPFTVKEEVLDDAVAAIALAKTTPDVDVKKVYLLGHSLGGMLAPRIATLSPGLAGLILAAAPARKMADISIEQNNYLFGLANDTTAQGKIALNNAIAQVEKTRITTLDKIKPDSIILGVPASYWVDLNNYDQVEAAKKALNLRMLIIQGGNDFQVSEKDYNIWKTALAGNSKVRFEFYPGLNHLLSQQIEKGNPSQYQQASNVAETLINDISLWIKE